MWKPLLPEFVDVASIEESARRAETLNAEALVHLFAARLDLGESSSLLADLRSALDDTPLDERLWAHLALALYRSGRQADALRALGDARRVLGEEVGVEPGPALKALEADILDQSPSLIWVPIESVARASPAAVRRRRRADQSAALRRPRARARRAHRRRAAGAPTVTARAIVISGEPGIGKTRLAEELVDAARPLGVAVAWARCPESAATSSFFAITEVAAQLEAQGVVDLTGRPRLRRGHRGLRPHRHLPAHDRGPARHDPSRRRGARRPPVGRPGDAPPGRVHRR